MNPFRPDSEYVQAVPTSDDPLWNRLPGDRELHRLRRENRVLRAIRVAVPRNKRTHRGWFGRQVESDLPTLLRQPECEDALVALWNEGVRGREIAEAVYLDGLFRRRTVAFFASGFALLYSLIAMVFAFASIGRAFAGHLAQFMLIAWVGCAVVFLTVLMPRDLAVLESSLSRGCSALARIGSKQKKRPAKSAVAKHRRSKHGLASRISLFSTAQMVLLPVGLFIPASEDALSFLGRVSAACSLCLLIGICKIAYIQGRRGGFYSMWSSRYEPHFYRRVRHTLAQRSTATQSFDPGSR